MSGGPGTSSTDGNGGAWNRDLLADPHRVADKAERVQKMFAAIARSYDLNNRVHSLGRDQAWRRKAVRLCEVRPGQRVLDVACGTGDLALAFADAEPAGVVGVDFTREMLDLARHKQVTTATQTPLQWVEGDAQRLPVASGSVDVVSIAFGIRNVAEPARALAEFHRVLRPGGRLLILEFSVPANPLLRRGYLLYFRHVLPRTATWISRDRSGAYRYLPQSVNTFLGRDALKQAMGEAGFGDVQSHPLTFGIAVAYLATRA
ncbi:MAG: bifunctional demethylmenaquinone methyltransferase/2-methoxy-6-polyprenyl-1,4-benzoquinol methylase UbiE [Phycisphaerae bacterium]|nr:bifunctional demethylmenaquinone methyltransferase/2-methoxy-6-polyprenyl-1,4-benzoquinol methylase UbiE [Phycisphaerae bacterium]